MRKNEVGLSIAELLVASGLLAMVLVTVMTLFGQLIKNTEKNALLAAGAVFADGVIDRFSALAQKNLDSKANPALYEGFDTPPLSVVGGDCVLENAEGLLNVERDGKDGATKYLYSVNAQLLPAVKNGQLWKVDVEVRWWQDKTDNPAQAHAGMGNMNVKRSAIVYLEY